MGEIKSRADIASSHASNIERSVSAVSLRDLAGVDDDNTLAESGVYNSCNSLKQTFETLRQALMADAENLRAAAEVFGDADGSAGRSF